MRYAGFWQRAAASLIDTVLTGVVFVPMLIVYQIVDARPEVFNVVLLSFLPLLLLLLAFLYPWLMTAYLGQTLGKMALGIRVVNDAGKAPGLGWAFFRETVGKYLSGLFFGLGYIWVAFDPHKRAWHDKMAGTYVVFVSAPNLADRAATGRPVRAVGEAAPARRGEAPRKDERR